MDQEDHDVRRRHHPQPAFVPSLFPAGFIGMFDRRFLHFGQRFLVVGVVLTHSLVGDRHRRFEFIEQRIVEHGPPISLRLVGRGRSHRPAGQFLVLGGRWHRRAVIVGADQEAAEQQRK